MNAHRTSPPILLGTPSSLPLRGVTIPQKGDSDSRGLRSKRLKEPTARESDSNFFISKIGKNKTPTLGDSGQKGQKSRLPGNQTPGIVTPLRPSKKAVKAINCGLIVLIVITITDFGD